MKQLLTALLITLTFASCARMGQPDGGWFDDQPPRVIATHPTDRGTNVHSKKIDIYFDEFIKIDNPTENVVVSPPQQEMPEIKSMGKRIRVELKDSLKPNTTYTVDFSNAISDNNEGNPLGNFTYSFSTGNEIDTMEVAGYVLQADNLEPVQGILVGLYDNPDDSVFTRKPIIRVARTDASGHFEIKGVKQGKYRVYALKDNDANFFFSQKSEMIAFHHDLFETSSKPDVRQDTLWKDSLHILNIVQKPYTHFLPDDVILRAFTEKNTDRNFIKAVRDNENRFSIKFTYSDGTLPELTGMNFNAREAFLLQTNERMDSLTYWLRDTALINTDTLRIAMKYLMTDTLGKNVSRTDTLELIAKTSYEKRLKQQEKEREKWLKDKEKAEKKGETPPPSPDKKALEVKTEIESSFAPDNNITFTFNTPVTQLDTTKIHLYSKRDTLWYRVPFLLREYRLPALTPQSDSLRNARLRLSNHATMAYELLGEWKPGVEYSIEVDSAAFHNMYGHASNAFKKGLKVNTLDQYASLALNIPKFKDQTIVVQLLNEQEKVLKELSTTDGTATFYYLKEGSYYVRMFVDENENGLWDTGLFATSTQPETVYYNPETFECKANWDVSRTWDPTATPIYRQKPQKLIKQKTTKNRINTQNKNYERARQKGIIYTPKP